MRSGVLAAISYFKKDGIDYVWETPAYNSAIKINPAA
jgi:hypothetical protein